MLVVVDYQVDFVDGVFGPIPDAIAIEEAVCEKITACQKAGKPIVFTMDTHKATGYEQTREGKLFGLHCVEGEPGWNLYGKVRMFQQTQKLIRKQSFGSMDLVAHAKEQPGLQEIELIGVSTDICVLSNAILLLNALPEARIVVDASACAAFSRSAHEAALRQLASLGAVVAGV